MRRLFARLIDAILFVPLWISIGFGIVMALPTVLAILLAVIWIVVPPFAVEAWMLSVWGTTPGKWMLSLRVETLQGTKLTFREALARTCVVTLVGRGLFIPIVSFITHLVAAIRLMNKWTTYWDEDQYRVTCGRMTPARWCALLTLSLGSALLMVFYRPPGV